MSDPTRPGGQGQAAGWYPDPTGRHQYRYWDGSAWTDNVSDGGVAGTDPIGGPGRSFAPRAAPVAEPGPPTGGPTRASRKPIFIGAGLVALAVAAVVAYLLLSGDDGPSGLGEVAAEVDDDGVFIRSVEVPDDSVLLIEVRPEGDFDPVLGASGDDELIEQYEDFFGDDFVISGDDVFSSVDEDDIPGTIFLATDAGGGGDDEQEVLPAPFGAKVDIVVAGFEGQAGEFELELSVEEFEGPDDGSDYITELFEQDFIIDFLGFDPNDFTDFTDGFTEFTDFSDDFFTDFTDDFFTDFTDFSDGFFTDFSDDLFSDLSDFSDFFTE